MQEHLTTKFEFVATEVAATAILENQSNHSFPALKKK
jgi:hypothetical protein